MELIQKLAIFLDLVRAELQCWCCMEAAERSQQTDVSVGRNVEELASRFSGFALHFMRVFYQFCTS